MKTQKLKLNTNDKIRIKKKFTQSTILRINANYGFYLFESFIYSFCYLYFILNLAGFTHSALQDYVNNFSSKYLVFGMTER